VVRPFAQEDASLLRRAGFIRHNLWLTAYDPAQRYAAGDYINQNCAPDGLDQTCDQSLENTDIVAWYTFGVHHLPRPEDWPVMPVAYAGYAQTGRVLRAKSRDGCGSAAPPMLRITAALEFVERGQQVRSD